MNPMLVIASMTPQASTDMRRQPVGVHERHEHATQEVVEGS